MSGVPNMSLEELLPAIYRIRDSERNGPLGALLNVIEQQVSVVHDNIEQLYDDQFIETCQPWVVPYLGELVGIQPRPALTTIPAAASWSGRLAAPRLEVANAIALERRKGTLAAMEDLARSVAKWPARAVEFYPAVVQFQSIRHPAPEIGRSLQLRDKSKMAEVGTPFDSVARFVDLNPTRPSARTPKYHPDHAGLFVWRLNPYRIYQGRAKCICPKTVGETELRIYTFDSVGLRVPLTIKPESETDPLRIAGEINLPGALTLRALSDWECVNGSNPYPCAEAKYYGRDKSLAIWFESAAKSSSPPALEFVLRGQVLPIDLSCLIDCECAGSDKKCQQERENLTAALTSNKYRVAVDPEHGLLAIVETGRELRVTYHNSFSADLGGGEYRRPDRLDLYDETTQLIRIRRAGSPKVLQQICHDSLLDTSARLICDGRTKQSAPQRQIVIEIADNDTYLLHCQQLQIPNNTSLTIRAAKHRRPTIELQGDTCNAALTVEMSGSSTFTLDGVRVVGGKIAFKLPEVAAEPTPSEPTDDCARKKSRCDSESLAFTHPPRVFIKHCTLVPKRPQDACSDSKTVEIDFLIAGGCLTIDRSIVSRLAASVDGAPARFRISDSIVDWHPGDSHAIDGKDSIQLSIERVTVIGSTLVREIEAQDCLFHYPCQRSSRDVVCKGPHERHHVKATRLQVGGMRFCFVLPKANSVPPHWQTPAQYYCQPSQALERENPVGECPDGASSRHDQWKKIQARFTDLEYGSPGYCQLASDCSIEIQQGAESGSEVGVFHNLYQPQRQTSLAQRVAEFTPISMTTDLFFVT